MLFRSTPLAGAFVVEAEPKPDERGFFARIFSESEFAGQGLVARFPEVSLSRNTRRGTVRGMHFQADPHGETKIVRCVSGAIHDVIVDLRRGSATYLQSFGIELNAEAGAALYIPAAFAHGFQTLRDDTDVLYMIDQPYVPTASRGIRWNDPAIHVTWPLPISVIAERDLRFPDWEG